MDRLKCNNKLGITAGSAAGHSMQDVSTGVRLQHGGCIERQRVIINPGLPHFLTRSVWLADNTSARGRTKAKQEFQEATV